MFTIAIYAALIAILRDQFMFTVAIYAAPIAIVRGRCVFTMHMGLAGEDTAVLHSEQNQLVVRGCSGAVWIAKSMPGLFWIAKSMPETFAASQLARASFPRRGSLRRNICGRHGAESKGSRTNVANHNRSGSQGGSYPGM